MATATVGFRFVRCPKCKKILAEFANVPVYQCGGCGTTLRSKIYNASRENITVASQDLGIPDSGSFDSVLPSFNNELESADGVLNAEASNQQLSNLDDSNSCCEEVPELEVEENSTDVRGIVSESPRPSDERNDMNIMVQNDTDCNGKSPKLCQQDQKSLRSSEQIQESAESSTSLEAMSSVENETNRDCHDGNESTSGSTTVNSNSYDGSVSSGNDRILVRRRIGVSRRTFRQRKVQDSADTDGHRLSAGTQVQNLEVSQEPSNEQVDRIVLNASELVAKSDLVNECDSNANELPTEKKSHKQNTSLNSLDFHSVQNWFEPESDEPLNPLSRDADFKLKSSPCSQISNSTDGLDSHEDIQREILRKVDELREEIGELFDKPDEGKGRTHLKFIQEQRPIMKRDSNFARLPLQHSFCKHCHHEDYRKHARLCGGYHHDILDPMMHMSPTRLPCCHKPQIEDEVEKPNKEKKQQIKRHCRPVLGGSPFVICYNCFQLLQLPIDFFIAMKRMHKLRCGSCSKILMFSFRGSNRRVPNEVEHSTSEMQSNTDATIRNKMYNSHLNDRSQSESITFSEEFADILAMRRYADTDESPISIGVQTRNGGLGTGLQLHKLMGYESASELLYRRSFIDEDFDITATATPHCNSPEAT